MITVVHVCHTWVSDFFFIRMKIKSKSTHSFPFLVFKISGSNFGALFIFNTLDELKDGENCLNTFPGEIVLRGTAKCAEKTHQGNLTDAERGFVLELHIVAKVMNTFVQINNDKLQFCHCGAINIIFIFLLSFSW